MKKNIPFLITLLLSFYTLTACMQGELIVRNGKGSGTYSIGEAIKIIAINNDKTKKFYRWVGNESSNINDPYLASTTILITKNINRIEAEFIPKDEFYDVTVVEGEGTTTVSPGTLVTIRANKPVNRYEFYTWIGDIKPLPDSLATIQSFHMPRKHVRVEATYREENVFKVVVINGIGSGNFSENKKIIIKAIPPNDHSYFSGWSGDTYLLANDRASTVTFLMPNSSVYLEAKFTNIESSQQFNL
jgi:hypothetical protein